jgi:hypothetical protein
MLAPGIAGMFLFPLLMRIAPFPFGLFLFEPQGFLLLTHLFLIKWAQNRFTSRFRETVVAQLTGESRRRISMKPAVPDYFGLLSEPRT